LVGAGSYCPQHHPDVGRARATPGRGSGSKSAAFREVVLAAAGYRCEAIAIVDGRRCTAVAGLEAHHEVPLREGGSNDPKRNGRALCRRHHRLVDLALREAG